MEMLQMRRNVMQFLPGVNAITFEEPISKNDILDKIQTNNGKSTFDITNIPVLMKQFIPLPPILLNSAMQKMGLDGATYRWVDRKGGYIKIRF